MTDQPAPAAEPRCCACVADGQPCHEREGRPFAFDETGVCRPCQNNHRGYLRSFGDTD